MNKTKTRQADSPPASPFLPPPPFSQPLLVPGTTLHSSAALSDATHCEIRAQGYTMKEAQHSDAFFALIDLASPVETVSITVVVISYIC